VGKVCSADLADFDSKVVLKDNPWLDVASMSLVLFPYFAFVVADDLYPAISIDERIWVSCEVGILF
jgi:hypothetical protein